MSSRRNQRTGWPSIKVGCTWASANPLRALGGLDDLIVEAAGDTFASAGVTKDEVDAYWFGTAQSGMSGITLARPLQLEGKPVTRVENYCATGSEALRPAAYAVAVGAYDVAMAVGAEKVKDSGYQGLNAFPIPNDGTARTLTAAAMFSMVAPAYAKKYGVDEDELREVLARIAAKNHPTAPATPGPSSARRSAPRRSATSPAVAGGLSVFDCAGRGRRGGRGHRGAGRGRPPLHRQAAADQGAVVRSRATASGLIDPDLRLHLLPRSRRIGRRRLPAGGHHRSARRAGHGRSARLLHPDRAGADGGPRVLRAGHRLEGGAGRDVRPRRCDAGQPRRRAQELRPSGRGVGAADDLRGVAAAAGRGYRRIGRSPPTASGP